MEEKDKLAKRIGSRMNTLRKQRGLTISEIVKQTHLSPSLISRIKNGQIMASVQTLGLIADALEVDIGFFFQQEHGRYVVSRQGSRRIIPAGERSMEGNMAGRLSYDVEPLAEGMENPFMIPLILKIVKKDDEIESLAHGGQEVLYILEGKVLFTLGDEEIILKKGDALYFDGNVPHKGITLGKKPAKALIVLMIPGRRVRNLTL